MEIMCFIIIVTLILATVASYKKLVMHPMNKKMENIQKSIPVTLKKIPVPYSYTELIVIEG